MAWSSRCAGRIFSMRSFQRSSVTPVWIGVSTLPGHAGDRGVVHDAVEAPPALERRGHGGREIIFARDVEAREERVLAHLQRESPAFGNLDVAERNAIAGSGESLDAGRAYAACP